MPRNRPMRCSPNWLRAPLPRRLKQPRPRLPPPRSPYQSLKHPLRLLRLRQRLRLLRLRLLRHQPLRHLPTS